MFVVRPSFCVCVTFLQYIQTNMPYESSEDPSNPNRTNTHQTSPRLANLVLLWQPIQYKAYIIWKHIIVTTLALASMTTWAISFELVISVLIPTTQKINIQNQRTEHKGHCNTGSGRWQEDVSVMTICDECRHFHDDMWRAHAWPFFSEERWMLTRVAKSSMLHWSQMAPLHCAAQFHEVEPSELARSWIKASLTHANLLTLRPDLWFRKLSSVHNFL